MLKIVATIWIVALACTIPAGVARFCKKSNRIQWVVRKQAGPGDHHVPAPMSSFTTCGATPLVDLPADRLQVLPLARTKDDFKSDFVQLWVPQYINHPPFAPPRRLS